MNIFVLHPSESPTLCALWHCDQHVNKMLLESAQMVSTAIHAKHPQIVDKLGTLLYAPAYINHPCTKWTAECPENILWICELAQSLEFIRKFWGNKPHASSRLIREIYEAIQMSYPRARSINSSPPIFVGDCLIQLRRGETVSSKYQRYYVKKLLDWRTRGRDMTYKGREVPEFLHNYISRKE